MKGERYDVDEMTSRDMWRIFRIMSELVEGFDEMSKIPPAVSIFGSKMSQPGDKEYELTRTIAAKLAERGFAVITGGGPGIMEAGNKGAFEAGGVSVGLGIDIPGEGKDNRYQTVPLNFHYFFVRKVMFVKYAVAFVMMPGGLGSLDELFEAATLMQTGKIKRFPLYLVGSDFWKPLLDWLSGPVLAKGFVKKQDLELMTVIDDIDELVEAISYCKTAKGQDLDAGPKSSSIKAPRAPESKNEPTDM